MNALLAHVAYFTALAGAMTGGYGIGALIDRAINVLERIPRR